VLHDGTSATRLTSELAVDPYTKPRWTPDGSGLVIRGLSGTDQAEWWLVAADGSRAESITARLEGYWYGPVIPAIR
jgi:hypothetical protein